MNECARLSDRIPVIVLAQGEWTPEERQHLTDCDACRAEWNLISAASRLGADVEGHIEVESIVGPLLRRLSADREAEQFRRRRWTIGGLAAAAVLLLSVWMGGFNSSGRSAPAPRPAVLETATYLPELDSLKPAELDSVLQTMDEPADASSTEEVELRDLNAEELQRVLDNWEG